MCPLLCDVFLAENFVFLTGHTSSLSIIAPQQEAVDIVQRNLHRGYHEACQELIETAAARWQEEEGDYRDDVSI